MQITQSIQNTNKILTPEQAIKTAKQLQTQNLKIVLAGGCFDILHIGHITFLEKAKKQGDILFLFVENDETIHKQKGPDRPFNSQHDRAAILAHLTMVDYVIPLPAFTDNSEYDTLVKQIKPAIIATTVGDPTRKHKERQARLVGGSVIDVVPELHNQSTTRLVQLVQQTNQL